MNFESRSSYFSRRHAVAAILPGHITANKKASQLSDVPEIDGFGVMADHLDLVVDVATGVLDPCVTTHL